MDRLQAAMRAPIDRVFDLARTVYTPLTADELLATVGASYSNAIVGQRTFGRAPHQREQRLRAFAVLFSRFSATASDAEYVRLLGRLSPDVKARLFFIRYEKELGSTFDNGRDSSFVAAFFTPAYAGDAILHRSEVEAAGGIGALLEHVKRVVSSERDLLLAATAQPFADAREADGWACRWSRSTSESAAARWQLTPPNCGGALSKR